MKLRRGLMLCCAALFVACGSNDKGAPAAAGSGGAGGGQAGRGGAGGRAGGATDAGPAELGAPCTKDTDCSGGLSCDTEIKHVENVPGAPGGTIDVSLFPGGSCTPLPLATYNPNSPTSSCNLSEPVGAQGCGANGVCAVVDAVSTTSTQVACRKACTPSESESGCERAGYTCDFNWRACVEGCRSDAECRVTTLDTNGDGQPDQVAYDDNSQATCDMKTARCVHPSGSQALAASCMSDSDCDADSICITPDVHVAAQSFPGGYCSRVGCDVSGRECGDGYVCEPIRPWLGASPSTDLCLASCVVGSEPKELQLGPSGHGAGCRDGYRCHYNGGQGAQDGVCVGGNYNAVTQNNIGSACQADSDCYSPFGAGRCLVYSLPDNTQSPGICTVLDCGAPGIPDDVCGVTSECIGSGSGDETYCASPCKMAKDCPSGYACYDDDQDPATSKVCYPLCATADDCRSGEQCKLFSGTSSSGGSAGKCVLQ